MHIFMRHHSCSPHHYTWHCIPLTHKSLPPPYKYSPLEPLWQKNERLEELIEITSLHSHIEAIRRDKQRNRQSEREASRGTPWGRSAQSCSRNAGEEGTTGVTAPFFTVLIRDSCQCEGRPTGRVGEDWSKGWEKRWTALVYPVDLEFIYLFYRVETQGETCEEDGPTFLSAAAACTAGSHLTASSHISCLTEYTHSPPFNPHKGLLSHITHCPPS